MRQWISQNVVLVVAVAGNNQSVTLVVVSPAPHLIAIGGRREKAGLPLNNKKQITCVIKT
jgi:hypothetical protein